ncbi:wall-associated receptor kinase-like 15, partial [Quercus suber]
MYLSASIAEPSSNNSSTTPTAESLFVDFPPPIQKGTCYSSDFSSEGLKLDENLPFNISTPNTVMLFNCTEPLYYWALNCSSTSFCRQFENNDQGYRVHCLYFNVNRSPDLPLIHGPTVLSCNGCPSIEFGRKATKRVISKVSQGLELELIKEPKLEIPQKTEPWNNSFCINGSSLACILYYSGP